MTPQHHLPADIERTSMGIITAELAARGLAIPPENAAVVKRVIHTTADFDYAENLRFTPGAAAAGVAAMRAGATVITDTNMALAGITKPGLAKLGGQAHCFMADPAVAAAAKAAGSTRAAAAMHRAAREYPGAVLAVGNAPTALLTIADEIENGLRPALVIAVPVGFVNVVESKERLFAVCTQYGVPAIAAMGRKGGSNVAAAICNALVYSAAEMLDPAEEDGSNTLSTPGVSLQPKILARRRRFAPSALDCRKRCAHPLAPSARGLRPQAVGERTVRLPEIFRAMARFSPSAPSGHLPRRGRFFDTLARRRRFASSAFLFPYSFQPSA